MKPSKKLTLGAVVTIKKGKKHSVSEAPSQTTKRLIGIGDLRNDDLIRFTNDQSGTESVPDDILIAWDGANAGTIGFGKSGFIGSTIARLRSKEKNQFYTPFLGAFLKSKFDYLRQTATGATIPHINRKALEGIVLPNVGLDDQKRIAYVLGKVEALIAQRKQHLQQLDDLLKSIFIEIFGNPVRNEKGGNTNVLEGLCEKVIDCPHSTPTYSDEKTGFFCVRSGDIVNGYLDLNNTLQVELSVYEERIKRHTPQTGDILYSREGGRLGNAARILGDEKVCLGQRIMLLKANAQNESDFLWALLESTAFKSKVQGLVGGGAAPRVNIKDLRKIVVIQPPLDNQIVFSNITQKLDQIKSRYQQSLTDLETLYGALSQKAFKGELDLSRVPLPPEDTDATAAEPPETSEPPPLLTETFNSLQVPLPSEDTDATAVEPPETSEPLPTTEPFTLPAPPELTTLHSTEGRHDLINQWLTAWLDHLNNGPFSTQAFMEAAQQRFGELAEELEKNAEEPNEDAEELRAMEFGAAEYDHLKAWIFESLKSGLLAQTYDDADNRVLVKAAGN